MIIKNAYVYTLEEGFVKKDTVIRDGYFSEEQALAAADEPVIDAVHVMPELICDGLHVHPSAVRALFTLFGEERMILISDSMRATGMSDGAYTLGGLDVTVKGNRATLSDGTIAGSVTNLMDCMRMAVSMGIPLGTAVRCATYNPAKSIGVEKLYGRIAPGAYGDCVILDRESLAVQKVILGGEELT